MPSAVPSPLPGASRQPPHRRRRGIAALVAAGAATCIAFGAAIGAAVLTLILPATTAAHEIPARVALQLYVAIEGAMTPARESARASAPTAPQARLLVRLLVRVPLDAMRDVDFPLLPNGALDLARSAPFLREAAQLWVADGITLHEGGRALPRPVVRAVRVTPPGDRAFANYATARAHLAAAAQHANGRATTDATTGAATDSVADAAMAATMAAAADIPWQQLLLDVELTVPITSPAAELAVTPALAHLGVRTTSILHFVPAQGAPRVFTYEGNPGRVVLDPRWTTAAWRFVALGVEHIVIGVDHLLFLLCLVLPVRRLRPLLAIVTAFTLGHSLTLVAAALGYAPAGEWFPPAVETLIAASIVFMAVENMLGVHTGRRWMVAFGFGLVHGFGFAFALRETLQFAGTHLLSALVAFNVGVELGQVALVALAVPLLQWGLGRLPSARAGVVVLSALAAHAAWHWAAERGAQALAHPWTLPPLDAIFVANLLRLLAGVALVLAVGYAVSGIMERLVAEPSSNALAQGRDDKRGGAAPAVGGAS